MDAIAVLTQQDPSAPAKVAVANAIATEFGATIQFLTAVSADASEELLDATHELLDELEHLCSVETESTVLKTGETVEGLVTATTGSDVALLGTDAHSRAHELLFGDPATDISDELDCSVLLVHPPESRG